MEEQWSGCGKGNKDGVRGMRKEQYPLEVAAKGMESQESLSQRFGKETVVGGDAGSPAEPSSSRRGCGVSPPHHPFYVPCTESPLR